MLTPKQAAAFVCRRGGGVEDDEDESGEASSSGEEGVLKTAKAIATQDASEDKVSGSNENKGATPESESDDTFNTAMDATSSQPDVSNHEERIRTAQELRAQGKLLHDEGDFSAASVVFGEAATLLQQDDNDDVEQYCTCRLHQALCLLKSEEPQDCIDVCTELLESYPSSAAAIRARAYVRRSKAYTLLEEDELALADARSAAFLGDRKGVALYGKLMRGSTSSSSESGLSNPNPMGDLFQAQNPFLVGAGSGSGAGDGADASGDDALLKSLLQKSTPNTGQTADTTGLPMDLMSSMLGGFRSGGAKQGAGAANLAKTLLKQLSERLENDGEGICNFLNNANPTQLQSMAQMAGVPLQASQAEQIAKFCHKVTPKMLRRFSKTTKRLVYTGGLIRKCFKVVNKYKYLLVLYALFAWTRSALRRPILVKTVTAKAAAVGGGA